MNVRSVLTLIPSDIIGVLLLILLSLDFPPSSLSDNFFMYLQMTSLLIAFTFLASLLCFYCSQFDGDYYDIVYNEIFSIYICSISYFVCIIAFKIATIHPPAILL